MKVQLFIEGQEIELNENVQFLLNKQYEELSNPTVIINDWSKTVKIPFTANNNRIFGYIYNPNMVITSDGTSTSYKRMFTYFDPTKKLDFKLIYNTVVLMTGYAKMNNITKTGQSGTYDITLYGQLGSIISELRKITFDTKYSDSNYIINGSQYVNVTMNRDLIYNCWNKSTFYYQLDSCSALDIIGFAPNNSFDKDFDYKTFQTESNTFCTFEKTLESQDFETYTGVAPSQAIPNGLLPREIGEYRSYLQIPYIFFGRLFQIFQRKAEAITGYTFNLDNTWFTPLNPYFMSVVMMASRPYDNESVNKYTNGYTFSFTGGTGIQWGSTWTDSKNAYLGIASSSSKQETYPLLNGDTYTIQGGETLLLNPIKLQLQIPANYDGEDRYGISWKSDKQLQIRIDVINADNNEIVKTDYRWYRSNDSVPENYRNFTVPVDSYEINAYYNGWDIIIPQMSLLYGVTGVTNFKLKFTFQWNGLPWESDGDDYNPGDSRISRIYVNSANLMNIIDVSFPPTSGSKITLNDLWNNDYNLFDQIINYCKMFRIMIEVDDCNKTINFIPYYKYFRDYTIEDWTDKLDLSKDFIVKPVSFDNKYVLFNYEKSDLKSQDEYVKKIGFNYGEKRLITDYNFNDETTKLFDKAKLYTSIVNTDNVLSWNSLFNEHRIAYTYSNEMFILCKDNDNKYKKQFGNFFFHNGLATFNTTSPMRGVIISDDSQLQSDQNFRCYGQSWESTNVTQYPKLSTTYIIIYNAGGQTTYSQNKCILFNKPAISYSKAQNLTNAYGIYDIFWKDYLDERYSIQNKAITCYLRITPADYIEFKFNKFILIDNQLYMINKIYDYDITNTQSTKVDLISVTNPDAYKSNKNLTGQGYL